MTPEKPHTHLCSPVVHSYCELTAAPTHFLMSRCCCRCVCSSLDQGSLCPINQLFCLSRQALHRPPPAPMKEHRLSPMREEPLSAPGGEDGAQTGGGSAAGVCQPGGVGSSGGNKKPRSRTKVQTLVGARINLKLQSLFKSLRPAAISRK